jgi:uncharacterized protein YerC
VNLLESEVGVMITNCTKKEIKAIRKMREQGYPYKTISAKINRSVMTIARYDRVYQKYGIEVFANDR